MSDSPQKISRQELYEKIWATPIVKLGKELTSSKPGEMSLQFKEECSKSEDPF